MTLRVAYAPQCIAAPPLRPSPREACAGCAWQI